ncbi:peptide MFS transporter [Novosphingobium sp.]|uniref:peptide MFS transporter n=1 Tax=Novosphingobium sp. TaxID=1874826 RepID=UPI0025E90A39|nr:peptide MFS transporter [Novosphingobium sp.]MCC6925414.1 peptide MFS transporter [Novosphingobium sp.]
MKSASDQPAGTFAGHPRGLAYLAGTELWERFSFYGMQALLTLYMVKQLLLPEFAQHVWGLAALRSAAEGLFGPMGDVGFASVVGGLYSGFVYFTPFFGGLIADQFLGAKRTVTIGVLLMSAGHLAMTFDQLFVIALVLLILGSGFLKGNISSQVGTLYPQGDASMRDRGFAIFSTGINIGAATGPLVTGAVAAIWGWHAGFAVAAGLMLVALATYLAGQKHLPETPPRRHADYQHPPLSKADTKVVFVLIAVILLTMPAEITYPMVWTIGPVWVDQYVDLGLVPATWFGSMDSIGSIIAAPLLVMLWAAQARKRREPDSIGKIAIGTGLVGIAALGLAAGSMLFPGKDAVPLLWAIGCYFVMGTGWMYYWPTTLSLVSRVAPPAVVATMVGGAFISPFIAHLAAGAIGVSYERMSPQAFWAMDGAIGLAGAVLLFALRPFLNRGISARSGS